LPGDLFSLLQLVLTYIGSAKMKKDDFSVVQVLG
jgi:hypothetical protein